MVEHCNLDAFQTQVQQQSPNNQQINQTTSNQTKIMNAVASAVACPPAASKKIRRRPENKVSASSNMVNGVPHIFFLCYPCTCPKSIYSSHAPILIEYGFLFSISLQPQSQINKCNNEKRRREQENEYIEQLGEFIHINKRDMNAPKPDKAAILNEVVKHVSISSVILNIKPEKNGPA